MVKVMRVAISRTGNQWNEINKPESMTEIVQVHFGERGFDFLWGWGALLCNAMVPSNTGLLAVVF